MVEDANGVPSAPAFVNVPVAPCGTSNLAWAASPEIAAAYQEPDGSIRVPDALVPYMGGMKKIEKAA